MTKTLGPVQMTSLFLTQGFRFVANDSLNEVRRRTTHAIPAEADDPRVLTDFDPLDRSILHNPYPAYRALRDVGAPLRYNPRRNVWLISRYEEVKTAARSHEVLLSGKGGITRTPLDIPMILNMDQPDHTRIRKTAMPSFMRGALAKWQPRVDALAAELVGPQCSGDTVDFTAEVSIPMPMRLIAERLGVPSEDYRIFRSRSDRIIRAADVRLDLHLARQAVEMMSAMFAMSNYLRDTARTRNFAEADCLMADWVDLVDSGRLSEAEFFYLVLIMLLAGNETTTNLLSTMMLSLARNPDQYQLLRSDPSLITACVQEALRHVSPVQGFYRTAGRDYRVGDHTLPANARVLLLFGAANRDPRHYPHPDDFVIRRNPTDSLAFGSGIHHCLGVHLAKLEVEAVLRQVVARVERVELRGRPQWTCNANLRGLSALPLALVPG